LVMRHQGSSTPSLRARIAVAAKLAVTDTRVGPPIRSVGGPERDLGEDRG
jgi:hypothetical protein